MANEITLAYMQEMVRRREGRLGEKQQILRLMSAVGRLAESLEDERQISAALGDVLYNTLALANTYGIDYDKEYENCVKNLKPADIQNILNEILASGIAKTVIMRPDAAAEAE